MTIERHLINGTRTLAATQLLSPDITRLGTLQFMQTMHSFQMGCDSQHFSTLEALQAVCLRQSDKNACTGCRLAKNGSCPWGPQEFVSVGGTMPPEQGDVGAV